MAIIIESGAEAGGQNVIADLKVDKCQTRSDLFCAVLSGNVPADDPDNNSGFILKV